MDELARELAALREELVPAWNEARSERLYAGVGQLRRRRRAQKAGACAIVAAAACGLLYLRNELANDAPHGSARALATRMDSAEQRAGSREVASSSAPDAPDVKHAQDTSVRGGAVLGASANARNQDSLQLADGSHAQLLSGGGELSVERNEPERVELRLSSGVAHFDVVPNAQRRFDVMAGGIEVSVVGTVFDVERTAQRVRVAVSRGKVRVRALDGWHFVQAGESSWFEDRVDSPAVSAAPAVPTTLDSPSDPASAVGALETNASVSVPNATGKSRATRAHRASSHDEGPRAAWRSLSQSGDYDAAYRLIAEGSAVEDSSEALLDAADAARLSGHPEAAIVYLRKVLREHRASPVAPLAAFTLGRVLLDRLGQPSEAADAFAAARELAPQGSLAQDALAREVEAFSKAGHPQEAYQRARLYVSRYPDGRRLRAVQLYGGLRAD
jgi:transmembrane sensor